MTLDDDRDPDSLLHRPLPRVGTDSRESADGLVDYDGRGHVVGMDLLHAPERVDLTAAESRALPIRSYSA